MPAVIDRKLVEPLALAAFAVELAPSLVLRGTRSQGAGPAVLPAAVMQACAAPQRRWCIRRALETWAVAVRIALVEAELRASREPSAAGLEA